MVRRPLQGKRAVFFDVVFLIILILALVFLFYKVYQGSKAISATTDVDEYANFSLSYAALVNFIDHAVADRMSALASPPYGTSCPGDTIWYSDGVVEYYCHDDILDTVERSLRINSILSRSRFSSIHTNGVVHQDGILIHTAMPLTQQQMSGGYLTFAYTRSFEKKYYFPHELASYLRRVAESKDIFDKAHACVVQYLPDAAAIDLMCESDVTIDLVKKSDTEYEVTYTHVDVKGREVLKYSAPSSPVSP